METFIKRKRTKEIKIGDKLTIGGASPIIVQSMLKHSILDRKKVLNEIKNQEEAKTQLIRIALPDKASINELKLIKPKINTPVVADIHFNYKLAMLAIESGCCDKLRINPANIKKEKIKEIIKLAKERKIPIRIGVNQGSFPNKSQSLDELIDFTVSNIKYIEDLGFYDLVISLKSSDVLSTIKAYRRLSELVDYPLHLGLTEAGPIPWGVIKSSITLGVLLLEGIGDTIRVSLTADSVIEIRVAYKILQALGLRDYTPEIISCPTCGRCNINLPHIVEEVERNLYNIYKPLKVAVMGCAVNGPGEAKEADIGIAGGRDEGVLFKKGKIIKRLKEEELVNALLTHILNF